MSEFLERLEKRSIEQGLEEGRLKTLFSLARKKLISIADAAKEAELTETEFISKMNAAAAGA